MKATSIRPTHPRKVKTLQQQNEKKVDEKKVPTPINVPKVINSNKTKRPDFTELQKPLVTSFSCMSDVIEAFTKGTNELKELVNYECELIYECKICRSLFRSLSNFIQHKRIHCLERIRDLKTYTNGEISDKVVHINGNNTKGQILTTRKTIRKDIYDLLRKVGNVSQEPVPEHFFTKDLKETDAALLSFFKQEGKAESEEKTATLGSDGFIVGINATNLSTGVTVERNINRSSESESKRNDNTLNRSNHTSSDQLMNCERLFNSQKQVTSSNSCPKLRHCYVCPLCQRYFCRIWSVQRHLHLVHKKLAEQIRKLQKKIKVKMVSVDQLKLRTTGPLLPEPKKADEESDGLKAAIPQSPIHSRSDSYPLVANQTFKRESPVGNLPNKASILEVRAYDKRPSTESCPVTSMHNLPQPRVLLTKANISTSLTTQSSKSLVETVESSLGVNPPKKPKLEPDLSWLKKGPSVSIIRGPLTRNARALYGNSSVNTASDSTSKALRDLKGVNSDSLEQTRKFVNSRVSDSNSDGERSSDSEAEPVESDEENVDFDVKTSDALSNVNSDVPNRRDCFEERINEDHLSSEDNVHSLASSSDSFDSMPNKEDNLAADQASTSGVETDISPDVDPPTMSGDDSGDIERLIHEYSKPQSPDPVLNCSTPADTPVPNDDRTKKSDNFSYEKPILKAKSLTENGHFKGDVYLNGSLLKTQKANIPSSLDSEVSSRNSTTEPLRPTNEPNNGLHSRNPQVDNLVSPVEKTNELMQIVGSDDSNDILTDTPEQLESRVMEVIFGSLPSTSYSVSAEDDGNNSS